MAYTSLCIENFRGIENFEITDLKTVNVLVGKNNCGKTSILEALFLLGGMSNNSLSITINHLREIPIFRIEDFDTLFKDSKKPIIMRGIIHNTDRFLEIKFSSQEEQFMNIKQNTLSDGVSSFKDSKKLTYTFSQNQDVEYKSEILFDNNAIRINPIGISPIAYEEPIQMYLRSSSVKSKDLAKFLGLITKENRLESVLSILRYFEPNITDLREINNQIYYCLNNQQYLNFNLMGDGIINITMILATILSLPSGSIYLVDEIENGLHHRILDIVWKAILQACKERSIQLITTTHSEDVIKSLVAAEDSKEDRIRFYIIQRKNTQHSTHPLNIETMKMSGIDIR